MHVKYLFKKSIDRDQVYSNWIRGDSTVKGQWHPFWEATELVIFILEYNCFETKYIAQAGSGTQMLLGQNVLAKIK